MNEFPKIFKVKCKPNSVRSEYLGKDDSGLHLISLAAMAVDNKANIALIKFFKKKYKMEVRIKSGLTSKIKLLEQL